VLRTLGANWEHKIIVSARRPPIGLYPTITTSCYRYGAGPLTMRLERIDRSRPVRPDGEDRYLVAGVQIGWNAPTSPAAKSWSRRLARPGDPGRRPPTPATGARLTQSSMPPTSIRNATGRNGPSPVLSISVTLAFAVLGDSIAYGQGAARPSDTISARLAAELTSSGVPTEVRVFAVPGADSHALASQIGHATAWKPDLALIIIGANDLTRFAPPQRAARQLADAVRALRSAGAQVVVAPAPDLSVVPWVPPEMRTAVRAGSRMLQQAQTRAAAAAGAWIADLGVTSTEAFATDPALFSADRFHPSSAGYAVITRALVSTIREAAAAAQSHSTAIALSQISPGNRNSDR
jgi:lysophospholipase L1-like esterase